MLGREPAQFSAPADMMQYFINRCGNLSIPMGTGREKSGTNARMVSFIRRGSPSMQYGLRTDPSIAMWNCASDFTQEKAGGRTYFPAGELLTRLPACRTATCSWIAWSRKITTARHLWSAHGTDDSSTLITSRTVNDTLGHDMGDVMLQDTAEKTEKQRARF